MDASAHSDTFPESASPSSPDVGAGLEKQPWMPFFKFVQGSHHQGAINVDGATEVVHWVVKGKPFSIRVSEAPSPVLDSPENQLQWQDISCKAEVVYSKTRRPVKVATGQEVISVDCSVAPQPHSHRRSNADLIETLDSSLSEGRLAYKLKQGAGLELSVRLSILSSHLQNIPFCLNIKLYLRKQCVADWYSATIHSVSKWDKVRHLQDSVVPVPLYSPFPKSAANNSPQSPSTTTRVAFPSKSTPNTTSTRMTRSTKASQMPISSSISKSNPHLPESDDLEQPDSPIAHEDPTTLSTAANEIKTERYSTHSKSHLGKKKKKASGEEVFDLLSQIGDTVDNMERLSRLPSHISASTSANKKRRANWDASPLPSEEEAARAASVQLFNRSSSFTSSQSSMASDVAPKAKRAKLREQSAAEESQTHRVHTPSSVTPTPATVPLEQFEESTRIFWQLVEQMSLSEVRTAINNVLQTRPDLVASLSHLMNHCQHEIPTGDHMHQERVQPTSSHDVLQAESCALSASAYLPSGYSHALGLSQSSNALWGLDERYESMQSHTPGLQVSHFDFVASPEAARGTFEVGHNAVVLSPSIVEEDEDDSVTLSSPHSDASWGQTDWSYDQDHDVVPVSPHADSYSNAESNYLNDTGNSGLQLSESASVLLPSSWLQLAQN